MKPQSHLVSVLLLLMLSQPFALATYSDLPNFSAEFMRDYDKAQKQVNELRSVEPLVELMRIYRKENEQAELQLSIGLAYHQRTGVQDFAKAVPHLSMALQYDQLPERTYIQVLEWRGNAHEHIGNTEAALKDYLRGLIACSYHDLPDDWPTNKPTNGIIYINSRDPENRERARDALVYSRKVHYLQYLVRQRYYLVNTVRRLQKQQGTGDAGTIAILETLCPEPRQQKIVLRWLQADIVQPWP